jgi:hypothetical protein
MVQGALKKLKSGEELERVRYRSSHLMSSGRWTQIEGNALSVKPERFDFSNGLWEEKVCFFSGEFGILAILCENDKITLHWPYY